MKMNVSSYLLCLLFCITAVHADGPKIALEGTEWLDYRVYHADRNDLPRVLLIGDSISGGYFDGVAKSLEGKAYVSRLGSSKGVCVPAYFDEVKLAISQHKYAVIHFNNGLHGWAYTEEEYARDLAKLLAYLKTNAPDAKLVWASSTQIRVGGPKFEKFGPNNDRVIARNKIAAELMAKENIPVDDLYTLTEPHPDLLADGVHYKQAGNDMLISQVTQSILAAMKK